MNEETKKEFSKSMKVFSNKLYEYTDFSIIEQLFTFKFKESLMMMEEYMMNSFESHNVEKIDIDKGFDIYKISPKKPDINR